MYNASSNEFDNAKPEQVSDKFIKMLESLS